MKKNLLVIIVFLFALLCKAEEKVFPTSDAIWVIHLHGGYDEGQLVYGLSGDTIISTKNYQKLYLLSDTLLTITEADVYVGGIRQENKKVWMLPADQSAGPAFEEFLLYDFGAEVGETINFGKKIFMGWIGSGNDCRSATFKDIWIESLLDIDGRVWAISGSEHGNLIEVDIAGSGNLWLEQVGSLSGLFFMPPADFTTCYCGEASGAELICMKEKGEIKYLKDGCKSCFEEPFIKYSSVEDEFVDNKAKVSYNIATRNIKIESEGVNLPLHFKLFSIDGSLVGAFSVSDPYTEINFNKQLRGVYIYNITGQSISQSGKLAIE